MTPDKTLPFGCKKSFHKSVFVTFKIGFIEDDKAFERTEGK